VVVLQYGGFIRKSSVLQNAAKGLDTQAYFGEPGLKHLEYT
jgi:hypothetical protein